MLLSDLSGGIWKTFSFSSTAHEILVLGARAGGAGGGTRTLRGWIVEGGGGGGIEEGRLGGGGGGGAEGREGGGGGGQAGFRILFGDIRGRDGLVGVDEVEDASHSGEVEVEDQA